MDQSENRIFFMEVVFVHFPVLNSYLQKESSNVMATIDAWQATLRDVTTEEAISVIYRWTKDELPRPIYLELGDFALHLRGVVLRDRQISKQRVLLDRIEDRGDSNTRYSHVTLRPYIKRIFESADAYRAGQITIEQHRANADEILRDHETEYRKVNY